MQMNKIKLLFVLLSVLITLQMQAQVLCDLPPHYRTIDPDEAKVTGRVDSIISKVYSVSERDTTRSILLSTTCSYFDADGHLVRQVRQPYPNGLLSIVDYSFDTGRQMEATTRKRNSLAIREIISCANDSEVWIDYRCDSTGICQPADTTHIRYGEYQIDLRQIPFRGKEIQATQYFDIWGNMIRAQFSSASGSMEDVFSYDSNNLQVKHTAFWIIKNEGQHKRIEDDVTTYDYLLDANNNWLVRRGYLNGLLFVRTQRELFYKRK